MEIDLLVDYPKVKRDVFARRQENKELIEAAKSFGWEYFDRKVPKVCYGGYIYDGRWIPVVKRFIEHFKIEDNEKILDLGCAKGYMLYDFKQANPTLNVYGIDISEYAINCCPPEIHAIIGNAKDLSYIKNDYFDLVISINTIHNLPEEDCRKAVREIQRVGKKAFISVDAYSNEEEKERMLAWNTTAETIHSVEEWKQLFKEENYTGDYFWFIP